MEWRVACVRIPRFPIGAVQRAVRAGGTRGAATQLSLWSSTEFFRRDEAAESEKHWDEQLIGLSDNAPTRPRLKSATAAAARDGVRAGMTVTEARALCAELEVLPWDDTAVNDAITATTAQLVSVSPQVSPVAGVPGMWWVGATGLPESAQTIAKRLLRIATAWHPKARVAIADSCVAARAATWAGASFGVDAADAADADARALIRIIPPGGDADYLAPAPLSLLPMDTEMRDALRSLGVRTVGAFADLDAGDVEQRWGDDGLASWRLAHGEDPRRPVLARITDAPHAEMELATPASDMEPVLFLVRPAVERLVSQLVSESRAIAALSITLTLDDARGALPNARAHTVTREIRMPRPLARPAPLFERCRGLLSRWELSAPVSAVRLTVMMTSPLTGEQGNLLDTSWRDPGAADAALDRVRAELGSDVVVKPAARDGYTPERSGVWNDEQQLQTQDPRPKAQDLGKTHSGLGSWVLGLESAVAVLSSLRLLEKPEQVEVSRPRNPDRIRWRGKRIDISNAKGPERLSGDWWNSGFSRDYWRCEAESGELLLYRDAAGWWMQGWYD
jgi:protein ImuB